MKLWLSAVVKEALKLVLLEYCTQSIFRSINAIIERVELTVNTKKDTNGRVKLGQW